MTYAHPISPDLRMTFKEALELAREEAGQCTSFHALAKRIQMTEPKPVDPALEALKATNADGWASDEELFTNYCAELAKRGLKIGPIEGDER